MRHTPGRRLISLVAAFVTVIGTLLGVSVAGMSLASAADGTVSFVTAAGSSANSKNFTVKIPTTVRAGDLMILSLALNTDSAITGPAGWTRLEAANGKGMDGQLWNRQATAADAGASVKAVSAVTAKGTISLAVYRSSAGQASVSTHAQAVTNASTTTLTTPKVSVTTAGSWLVNVVAYRAGGAATAKLPTGLRARNTSTNTGSALVGATVADAAVATGTRGGQKVTMSRSVARGIVYSIVVKPGSTPVATNRAPVASFTASCTGLTCAVNASASSDPDGDALTYAWNFGDGATGSGVTTSHPYATAGTRTVTLTVSDGKASASTTRSVTVTAPTTNRPPVASFTTSCTGLTCAVDASASSDPDGDSLTYAWNFGDGATGTGVTSSRTYTSAGARTVTLTVSDGKASVTATRSVNPTSTTTPTTLPTHPRLVSDTALKGQPKITTGEINDLAYIGDRVFVAGGFTQVQNTATGNTTTYDRTYIASWNRVTGLVDPGFNPVVDGDVVDIEPSPDGKTLYLAGRFNTVNGVTKRKFAAVDAVTGATITGWTANANGAGTELEATSTQVFLGGQFSQINGVDKRGLAAVNAADGTLVGATAAKPSGTWSNDITGGIGVNGALNVHELLLTPDNSTLIVIHSGRQVAGQDRYGAALIDVATGQLLPWRTRLWEDNLGYVGGVQRAFGAAIAPDGKSFYVTSGSGGDRPPINDTIVKFPVAGNDFVEPLWVSRAFDSVYSVADSGQGVYIGGHFNWNESQTSRDPWPGLDDVGYGTGQGLSGYGLGDEVVRRDHLGALDPAKGKAVDWNPGSTSFEGNKAMLVTPWGLVTGGDGNSQGGSTTGRIAVFDIQPAPSTTYETTITEPVEGRVFPAGQQFTATGTAHAMDGVKQVQVTIRDRDTNRFLQADLTSWGTTQVNLKANLATPNAVDTSWSMPFTFATSMTLEITARTVGANGRDETKEVNKFETFNMTDKTPTATITGPSGVVTSTTFTVTGTASDDLGVRSIGYTIRDLSNNRYLQNDGTVVAQYNSFTVQPDVPGGTTTTWSAEVTVPYEGQWQIQVTPRDTAGQSSLDTYDRTWTVSSTGIAPTVTIQKPVVMNPPAAAAPLPVVPGAPITFSGTATDDEDLANVEVQLRNTTTGEAVAADGTWRVQSAGWYRVTALNVSGKSTSWTYTTPFNLTPGAYTFSVRATDDVGLTTASANQGKLTLNAQIPGDNPPTVALDVTGTTTGLQTLNLTLTGTATDDLGVASIKVALRDNDTNRYLQPDGTMGAAFATLNATLAAPNATNATWSLSRTLPTEGDWRVTAYAYDTAGQQNTSTAGATAAYPIYPGDKAPTVTAALLAPTNGTVFTDGKIIVSGRVEDDRQIAGAQVAIVNSLGQYMSSTGAFTSTNESWRTAFLNSPGSLGSNYSFSTPVLPAGTYTVRVRGVDNHGLMTDPSVDVTVTVQVPASNPPVASFTVACGAAPNRANVCTFDGRGTTDENPTALTYAWDFGNGTGSGALVNRTYTAAGTYTVTLTAKDEWGNIGTTQKTVTVTEPGDNTAPTALSVDTPACAGLSCSMVGRFRDNVGDSTTRVWSWGDGTPNGTSTGTVTGAGDQLVSTSHTYATAGTYLLSLTVTDGWGKTATVTRSVTVTG